MSPWGLGPGSEDIRGASHRDHGDGAVVPLEPLVHVVESRIQYVWPPVSDSDPATFHGSDAAGLALYAQAVQRTGCHLGDLSRRVPPPVGTPAIPIRATSGKARYGPRGQTRR